MLLFLYLHNTSFPPGKFQALNGKTKKERKERISLGGVLIKISTHLAVNPKVIEPV